MYKIIFLVFLIIIINLYIKKRQELYNSEKRFFTSLNYTKCLDNPKYSIVLCFTLRNCYKYLFDIFNNIKLLVDNCNYKITCIFVCDNCSDHTIRLVKKYKYYSNHKVIFKHIVNKSRIRTVRIAKARNVCLDILYNLDFKVDYHFMIDGDNRNTHRWNTDVINKYIENFDNDNWDCITFNRKHYYDWWALLIDDFKQHLYGFEVPNYTENTNNIAYFLDGYIKNKLKKSQNNSIECLSAFNGLAIFKTDRYKGIKYDGLYSNIKKLITDKEREYTIKFLQKNLNGLDNLKLNNEIDCCEHIYYNLLARKQNNCIIKISKFIV